MGSSHPNKMIDISVIIPCFRSPNNLSKYIKSISDELISLKKNYEIILINDFDNDKDMTWETLQLIKKNYKNIRIEKLVSNCGQQIATIAGISISKGKYILTVDDDGQHNPKYFKEMFRLIQNNDLIIAKLQKRKINFKREFGTFIVNKISKKIFKNLPNNFGFSSFRLVRGSLAREITKFNTQNPVLGFELLQICPRVRNITVNYQKRINGKSTYSFLKLIKYFHQLVYTYSNFYQHVTMYFAFLFALLSFLFTTNLIYSFMMGQEFKAGYLTTAILLTTLFSINFIILNILVNYTSSIKKISENKSRFVFYK